MGNFRDVLIDAEANATITEFMRRKIRERVKDPAVAEKLIPTNHGFGTRRVPLESGYYEVYNQPNVRLVDIRETPIERITPAGVKTSDAQYPVEDRKSTRLNSSHANISYAVFCLKKKK